jgi:hypothetical protein
LKSKYKTYKIKNGDTIISVATELGITVKEARNFHNIFSKEDEIIIDDFPSQLKELYVYPYIREITKDKQPLAKFDGYKLSFLPSKKKNNYGVMYTISSDEKEEYTIKFEVSVEYKGADKNGFYFAIDRLSKTFINDEEASSIADELAEKVGTVIYPLVVVTNDNGKWFNIDNFKEVQKRWEKVKKRILDEYEGEWVEEYLELVAESLLEESSLLNSLSNDWFLNAYFGGIYAYYTPYFKFKNEIKFPIVPNINPLVYQVEHTTEEYLDDYRQVVIDQKGVLADERAKSDIENQLNFPHYGQLYSDAPKAEGEFRAKYFLNESDNTIESLFLECSIVLDKPKKIQVVVSLLQN